MIVRNEESNLRELLPIVSPLVDEIVICDTGSTDDTVAFAESFGAKVVHYENEMKGLPFLDSFAAARNVALAPCTSRFLMWIDGDERISIENLETIRKTIEADTEQRTIYLTVIQNVESVCLRVQLVPNLPTARWQSRAHEEIVPSLLASGCDRFWAIPVSFIHAPITPEQMQGKYARNLRLLELQLDEKPDDVPTLYHVGCCYFGMNKHHKALEAFEKLKDIPTSELTPHLLGNIMRLRALTGDRLGAELALDRLSSVMPDHPLTRLFLADRATRERAWSRVIRLLDGVTFPVSIIPYPAGRAEKSAAHLLAQAHKEIRLRTSSTPYARSA